MRKVAVFKLPLNPKTSWKTYINSMQNAECGKGNWRGNVIFVRTWKIWLNNQMELVIKILNPVEHRQYILKLSLCLHLCTFYFENAFVLYVMNLRPCKWLILILIFEVSLEYIGQPKLRLTYIISELRYSGIRFLKEPRARFIREGKWEYDFAKFRT